MTFMRMSVVVSDNFNRDCIVETGLILVPNCSRLIIGIYQDGLLDIDVNSIPTIDSAFHMEVVLVDPPHQQFIIAFDEVLAKVIHMGMVNLEIVIKAIPAVRIPS